MKNTSIMAIMMLYSICSFSQVSTGKDQFVSRVGVAVTAGTGHAYGDQIEDAPWTSNITIGAFVDWQTRYIGFKTMGLWSTFEGDSFKHGTLSLEFLPKIQWPARGLYAGVGLYTILNAPNLAKGAIGLVGEVGWQRRNILIAARIRNTVSDLSSEISGKQHGMQVGAGVYYSFINN